MAAEGEKDATGGERLICSRRSKAMISMRAYRVRSEQPDFYEHETNAGSTV